jgi:cytochrome c-type biogenesis protein CcmH/NrfG
MTVDQIERDSDGEITPRTTPHNRFVLLSVLAFVALVTVFLLKKNMEPPPADSPSQPVASSGEQSAAEQAMPDMMHQIEHINDILAQDSSNYDAWVALGNIYFDANMPEEAIEHYEGALAIRPGDVNVLTDLATMKRAAGDSKGAIAILQRVVQTDSTFGQAWFNMGVIYSLDLQDSRNAVSAWKRFLAMTPESPHLDAVRKEIERIEGESGS